MPPRTGTARRWAALAALPAALAGLCALLLRGAFATPHPLSWSLLVATGIGAVARWGLARQRKTWHALEDGPLCAALYHALLGARLAAARRAERVAVRKRVADAEVRARELRLIAVSSDPPDAAERHLLAGVAEVEDVLRSALAIADAALCPHTIAVFLLSPDGESVRLRECASK